MDANIKNPQDALKWLGRSIREEAEFDGEMSNEHAIQLGFIQNMLAKFPRRNCDVGTAEEQTRRYCRELPFPPEKGDSEFFTYEHLLKWAQMPYEEGGAK